jgi:ABC-type branched-subunit amino acid transport system substrate-binding protein
VYDGKRKTQYSFEKFRREEKTVKSKILFISLAIVLALSVSLIGCTEPSEPVVPEQIDILAVRSISGPLSVFQETAMGPIYKYWRHVVNDVNGGIYVPEFEEKIPVYIDEKDDTSDMDTMTTLLETNLGTNKYKFGIGPCCTPFLQAAGPIYSLYGSVLVGAEGGCTSVAEEMFKYPYMFSNLKFSNWNQVPTLCEILDSWAEDEDDDVIDVYIMSINDLFGVEYTGEFEEYAANYTTINILDIVLHEPFTEDVGAQVEAAAVANGGDPADVLILNTYPPTPHAAVGYAIAHDLNFKGIVTGPAACYENWYDTYFGANAEGICGYGAWNEYSSAALREFTEGIIAYQGRGTMDWWGGADYYAGLQMLEEAIAEADQYTALAVRDVMASNKLQTIMGETWYTDYEGNWPIGYSGGLMAKACHPGEVGQWQHVTETNNWLPDEVTGTARLKPYGIAGNATEWMIFEVIDLNEETQTAPSIYPKPDWVS